MLCTYARAVVLVMLRVDAIWSVVSACISRSSTCRSRGVAARSVAPRNFEPCRKFKSIRQTSGRSSRACLSSGCDGGYDLVTVHASAGAKLLASVIATGGERRDGVMPVAWQRESGV